MKVNLSNETANDKSGRVASCPHITDPRTDQKGLSSIAFFSESVLGDMLLSKVILTGSGMFCRGMQPRLKQLMTCFQYGRWVS